jgi:beta-glucosidase-like glycosyl hydrolase
MEARAVTSRGSVEAAAQRALLAGADLILMTGDGSFRPVSLAVLNRARRDRAFRARVREAAARVLALKRRLGLSVSPPAAP